MRLTTLQADGLKSLRNISLRTPNLLALSGPNGAGKTAIHQAIKLAVLGYDPALGKTLGATRQLSGGRGDIEVGITFDGGFGIRRSAGRSMETEVAPPVGETTEKERQERINRETGAFVPSFDLASLLELSAEKRREALFALLPRSLADLDEDSYRHWLGYEEAADVVRKAIDKLWIERIVAAESPTEGLASAIAFARERFLEADRDRQAQEKVADAAYREAAATTEAVVQESTDDLSRLQLDLSVVEQAIGNIRQRQEEAERQLRRKMERAERIRIIEDRIRAGEAHVANLLRARDELTIPPAGAAERAEEALRAAEAELNAVATAANAKVEAAWEAASGAREAAAAARSGLEAARMRLGSAVAELNKMEGFSECPVCGSTAELERARARLRESVEMARAAVAEQERAANELREALVSAEEASLAAGNERRQLVAEKEEQVARAKAEWESARAAVERVRKASHDIRQAEALLEGIRLELAAMQGTDLPAPPSPQSFDAEIDAKERDAFALRERIRKLQEIARAAGKAEAARERADRQRAQLARLTERADALKRLYQALQRYRAHVIQHMVAPVEETANQLLQRIDPNKRFLFVFEREGKDTFDFGFEENGVFRSYDTASTGEDAFLAVVFVAALIAAVQPAWRVLLVDNAESIDDERRADLMAAIALVADRFDNVILAGCCDFADVNGWEVVDVEQLTGRKLAEVA